MTSPPRFGRYRSLRPLGSGAFATVWLAHDDVLDLPVAVKVLADNWAHQLDVRDRFLEEARILRRADSDRIVRVHDIGELDDGRPYFVMTHADRGSLADLLADGRLPTSLALAYGAETALAIAVLHDVGFLHRDLNPGNVLLRSGRSDGTPDRVLVADLGLAKAAANGSGFTLTVGTPGYAAPEQRAVGGGIDHRADVYAVGALVHHMLTGAPPDVDAGRRDLAAALEKAGVPERVRAVVLRAMSTAPDDRQADARALAAELTAAADRPAPPVRRPRRRRRRLVVAAALLLVLSGAAAATWVVLDARRDTVSVADRSGRVRLTVPAAWSGQLRDDGWDLGGYGYPGRRGAAITVAGDLDRWRDPRSAEPGVFVGIAPGDLAPEAVLRRSAAAACPVRKTESWRRGALSGRVIRHAGCAGANAEFVEAVLDAAGELVYVQVKAPAGSPVPDDVLAALSVAAAS